MKKISFIGWLSEQRDPVTFCKDGGSRAIIELPDNEAVASLALSTMRKHKIKFTAECLPNDHEEIKETHKTDKKAKERKEKRKRARALP